MRIEVGAKIKKTPTGFLNKHDSCSKLLQDVKDMEGTIVHVNRKHRHFTVEYDFGNGRKFCESFKMTRRPSVGGSRRVVLDDGRR